jgi:glycosyltransferase involved in cell wall biosynthesis
MLQIQRFKISVVIITCDRPEYLKTALQSVFEQTVKPYEVIVVDDHIKLDTQHNKVLNHNQINMHKVMGKL